MLNFNLNISDNINVAIYDNATTLDRYTVFYEDLSIDGMSGMPFNPSGFCQYVGDYPQIKPGNHLGKLITNANELPIDVINCIKQRASICEFL